MSKDIKAHPPHLGLAIATSGFMAIALAAGLEFLKIMDRLDRFMAAVLIRPGLSNPTHVLAPVVLWSVAGILAVLLATVMLNIPGVWRRLVVWGLTFSITLFWGPVLLLASFKPEIGVAIVAVLWSGFCAMVYANNHILPADIDEKSEMKTNDGTR